METVSAGVIEWAVAEVVLPGQTESGDRGLVTPTADGVLVAVVDGLGHGAEAAEAAKAAVRSLERHAAEPIIPLIRSCHRSLAGTRGVVMSVAAFDARAGTLTWVGVGNVEGLLVRAESAASPRRESLLLRGGVVGVHLPAIVAAILPVMRGDTLIFVTDGVRSDFAIEGFTHGESPQQLADRILAGWGTKTDDALVLVARYLGAAA
jgi:serine phosphatase RsbU (regulator of sigma subunit)